MPVGRSAEGLPIGVQADGRCSWTPTLDVAAAIEAGCGDIGAPPEAVWA
ncbi:MAG: hypothetical protein R2708_04725 [Vicinamibacterales bacterium]